MAWAHARDGLVILLVEKTAFETNPRVTFEKVTATSSNGDPSKLYPGAVNVGEVWVEVGGGVEREAPVMPFSMGRDVAHVVSFMIMLPSRMNIHSQTMHPLKVCLSLFRPQSVAGRSWRKYLPMNHPVSCVLTENNILLIIHTDVPPLKCCDLCNPSLLD